MNIGSEIEEDSCNNYSTVDKILSKILIRQNKYAPCQKAIKTIYADNKTSVKINGKLSY